MASARRRRTTWAIAASVLAHVAVLVVVALQRPTLPLPAVESAGPPQAIIPILLLPKAPPPAAGRARQSSELRLHRRPQRLPQGPLPVAPLPASPAPAPLSEKPPAPASASTAPVAAAPPGADLRLALRHGVMGCANTLNMSRAERERCEEQLGRGAAAAPFMPAAIAPRIRAYYDAVAEAKKDDGAPTPTRAPGRLGMFDANPRESNGHGPGVGCHIVFGPGEKPKGPPHALRLGPCFVEPPKGPLTPEVDITPP